MEVKGKETKQVTVEVEPKDAVAALIDHYGFRGVEWSKKGSKDNMVGYSEDVSYHGSPFYEHYGRPVTDFELDMYETLKHLQELIYRKNNCPAYEFSKNLGYHRLDHEEMKILGLKEW